MKGCVESLVHLVALPISELVTLPGLSMLG